MNIYLSGPMRGHDDLNRKAFAYAAEQLRNLGHAVFNPGESDEDDVKECFLLDTQEVIRADAVALLSGWKGSKGAVAEVALAHAVGIPVGMWSQFNETGPLGGLITGLPGAATDEKLVVNPSTGGVKGSKLARFDLIPPRPLRAVAEHYGKGAEKYEERNWERGYDWSLSYAALQRHANLFWAGEDDDPETQTPHMAAVAFHALALLEFAQTHPEFDNRPGNLAPEQVS